MHLDPDFEHLTYADNGARRGARIATLGPNDLLAFYAGLRSIVDPRELVYALVGLFVVQEVVRATDISFDRRDENAHTRWTAISTNDIVVRGRQGTSGRFDRCVRIGEWRDKRTAFVVKLKVRGAVSLLRTASFNVVSSLPYS